MVGAGFATDLGASNRRTIMYRTTVAFSLLALAAFGFQQSSGGAILQLKEEQVILEYNATLNEAVVIASAESEEALTRVDVRETTGSPMLHVWAPQGGTVSGFEVETAEASLPEVLATYAEGVYPMRARAVDGRLVEGSAVLSHLLPAPATVTYPLDGDTHVPTNPTVTWTPDPGASAYQVVLEQDENDGLTVKLPAGSGSFHVPDRVLLPGTETLLEIVAIGANGNRTQVEVSFTTR
jgi:hypothetical protein